LYVKDRQIENLQARIANTQENLDKLINSKMYEKGNQLIYELDHVNRQLRLFKDNVYLMERELKNQLRDEFSEYFRKQRVKLEEAVHKFRQFRDDIQLKVGDDVTKEKDYITKEISKKAEEYKNKELGERMNRIVNVRSGDPMNITGANNKAYQQNLQGYMEEIDNMTEIEARQELAEMWTEMRTLRMFWKTKEMLTKDKYEREIFILKKQLTSNACLWE
jgi:dsDNA-specific endonuclease/ATPase MutS2